MKNAPPTLPNATITAIFFDLDGTLVHDVPSSNQFLFDYAVSQGAPDLPGRRIAALRWAHGYWANLHNTIEHDFARYQDNLEAFWENYTYRYLLAYGCPEDQARALAPQARAYMSEHYQPENTLAPDAHPTLARLRNEGYTLGLITNRSKPVLAELQALGISHYFDLILAAGEINTFKPEPAIFEHALRQTGISPHASLYLGDNYYADILGAERAGMHAVLLDPDRVFPEAGCPVVDSLADIHPWLNGSPAPP